MNGGLGFDNMDNKDEEGFGLGFDNMKDYAWMTDLFIVFTPPFMVFSTTRCSSTTAQSTA